MSDLRPESSCFAPFPGLLFSDPHAQSDGVMELNDVIAPLPARHDEAMRARLQEANAFNVSALLDRPEALDGWKAEGWLASHVEPALFLYRIGFTDASGQPRQWSGVVGQLEGEANGTQIIPELVSVQADGFSELLVPMGMPLARATDAHGAHHRLWPITQGGVISLIADAVVAHGEPGVDRLPEGAMVLAFEATEPFYEPALGMVLAE